MTPDLFLWEGKTSASNRHCGNFVETFAALFVAHYGPLCVILVWSTVVPYRRGFAEEALQCVVLVS